MSCRRHFDVGGFEIPVDDPFFVRGVECVGDLSRNRKGKSTKTEAGVHHRYFIPT